MAKFVPSPVNLPMPPLQLLTHGRRTALPRHQTCRAALDWSYQLLSDTERLVFRRLGILVGRFHLDAAKAVTGDDSTTPQEVEYAIANLVDKSLVAAQVSGEIVHYRLLGGARAYALFKLAEAGELQTLSSRRAEYRDFLARSTHDWTI